MQLLLFWSIERDTWRTAILKQCGGRILRSQMVTWQAKRLLQKKGIRKLSARWKKCAECDEDYLEKL